MNLDDLKFPVYQLGLILELSERNKGIIVAKTIYGDTVIDNKNIPGDLAKRRLTISTDKEHYGKLYSNLRGPIFTVAGIYAHLKRRPRNKYFIDSNGTVCKVKGLPKVHSYCLDVKDYFEVEGIGRVIKIAGIPQYFSIPNSFKDEPEVAVIWLMKETGAAMLYKVMSNAEYKESGYIKQNIYNLRKRARAKPLKQA